MALYKVASGDMPLASDIDQVVDVFSGVHDIGAITFAPVLSSPSIAGITATAAAGTALGIGTYRYALTYKTGYKKTNGTFVYTGETLISAEFTITTTSANQNVNLAGLPTAWPSSVVSMTIYRTAVGGASGTQKAVTIVTTPSATYADTVADASLGVVVPTLNTTGTSIKGTSITGINAISHADALNGVMHFENTLMTSRGVPGTFTRASAANNGDTLATLANNVPSYVKGQFGKGVSIWEGTTQLVQNSDFETVTATATVFSDPMTSGTAWTVASGSFTYASGGATSGGAASSIITAGNSAWKPITGSGGQNLALTTQATFTEPSAIKNTLIRLYIDANNWYQASIDGTTFHIYKTVNGTLTELINVSQTTSASTTYTITLSRDINGLLTAKLYSGTGTAGALLQTLTATDTSLTGGFLVGVGGDTGVVVSGVSVTAPWADGWTIGGGDARIAWALTSNVISGSYSVSAVGVASGVYGQIYRNITSLSASTSYSLSGYINTSNVGAAGSWFDVDFYGASFVNSILTPVSTGTNATTRKTVTGTSGAGVTNANLICVTKDVGTATFDAIQLEQKAYATPYLRNDSTSASATRAAETLTYPSSLLSAAAGTIGGWVNPSWASSTSYVPVLFHAFSGSNNGRYWVGFQNQAWGMPDASLMSPVQSFSANTKTHVTLSWDTLNLYLYVNGSRVATVAKPSDFAVQPSNMYIGHHFNGNSQLDGSIDELAVFNRSLTDAEVYSLYAATQPMIDVFQSDAALPAIADPTLAPTGLVGTLTQWVSWITNRIKAITGTANWFDAPRTTLANAVKLSGDTMTGDLLVGDPNLASDGHIILSKSDGGGNKRTFRMGLNTSYYLSIGDYVNGSGPYTEFLSMNYANGALILPGQITYQGTVLPQLRTTNGYVEWNNAGTWQGVGGVKNVQRGVSNVAGSVVNITITAVNMAKAFVNFPNVGNVNSATNALISAQLTSSTNLQLTPTSLGAATQNVSWEVVESY